jgi:hypothetical protein
MYLLHQFLNQRVSNQNFHNHHLNIPDNIITKPEGNNMLRPIGYINAVETLEHMVLCKLDEVQGTDNTRDHLGQCTDFEASETRAI